MAEGTRQRWKVVGADKQSGAAVNLTVEAKTAAAVEAEMNRRGVLVSSVTPAPLDYSSPAEESGETPVHVESVSPSAAFRAGLYGGFGLIVAWFIFSTVVGFILYITGVTLRHLLGF